MKRVIKQHEKPQEALKAEPQEPTVHLFQVSRYFPLQNRLCLQKREHPYSASVTIDGGMDDNAT